MTEPICELPACSKAFTPARKWQKFCSRPCKQAAERAKREEMKAAAGAVEKGKNAAAVALGKLSMAKRSPEERTALARKGGLARAAKAKQQRRSNENNS